MGKPTHQKGASPEQRARLMRRVTVAESKRKKLVAELKLLRALVKQARTVAMALGTDQLNDHVARLQIWMGEANLLADQPQFMTKPRLKSSVYAHLPAPTPVIGVDDGRKAVLQWEHDELALDWDML